MVYSWLNKTKEDYQGNFEKYTYDENGNLICQEDDKGNFSKWEYDENGNLIFKESQFVYYAGESEPKTFNDWATYEYDENGNLIYEEGCDETNSIGDYWKEYIVLEI